MTDTPDQRLPLFAVQRTVVTLLLGAIHSGLVEIEGKSLEQIIEQFDEVADSIIENNATNVLTSVDWRDTLLDRAKTEVEDGKNDLAVTFYAIWIEHFINSILTSKLHRMGHDQSTYTPLIRELHLKTKATALWEVAGLPAISSKNLKIIDQVIEFRNSFVHYKWTFYDDAEIDRRNSRLSILIAQVNDMVADLLAAESSIIFDGRDKEITEYVNEALRKKRENSEGTSPS